MLVTLMKVIAETAYEYRSIRVDDGTTVVCRVTRFERPERCDPARTVASGSNGDWTSHSVTVEHRCDAHEIDGCVRDALMECSESGFEIVFGTASPESFPLTHHHLLEPRYRSIVFAYEAIEPPRPGRAAHVRTDAALRLSRELIARDEVTPWVGYFLSSDLSSFEK